MNEPREPERPEDPGISLPSWVDAAIVKSGGKPSAEPNPIPAEPNPVTDVGPAAEIAVNPPPAEPAPSPPPSPTPPSPPSEAVPPEFASEPTPSADTTPEDASGEARKAAGLPWLGLALLFLAAALVIGYLMLTRAPK